MGAGGGSGGGVPPVVGVADRAAVCEVGERGAAGGGVGVVQGMEERDRRLHAGPHHRLAGEGQVQDLADRGRRDEGVGPRVTVGAVQLGGVPAGDQDEVGGLPALGAGLRPRLPPRGPLPAIDKDLTDRQPHFTALRIHGPISPRLRPRCHVGRPAGWGEQRKRQPVRGLPLRGRGSSIGVEASAIGEMAQPRNSTDTTATSVHRFAPLGCLYD